MAETSKHKSDGVKEAAKPARRFGLFEQKPETLLEPPDVLALQRALADPQRAVPAEVRALQAIAGNRAVQRLLVQRQLPEEEEEILQAKALQRQPVEEEEELLQVKTLQRQPVEEEEELMMKPLPRVGLEGGPVPEDVASGIQRARAGGRPLERGVREQMSAAMGFGFSGVRVHTGAQADQFNLRLSARAFTTGRDIFFRRGEYAPGSGSGRQLLAHELTHVVQQSTGQVRGGGSGMRVRPAGDSFEQEAEAVDRNAIDLDRMHRLKTGVIIQRALDESDARTHVATAYERKTETVLLMAAGIGVPRRIKPSQKEALIDSDTKRLIACLNHYLPNWKEFDSWDVVAKQLKVNIAEESAKRQREIDVIREEREAQKPKPQDFVKGAFKTVKVDGCTSVAQGYANMKARWVQVGQGLKTGGAGPCVVVALAGKDRVALAHFDSDSNEVASNHVGRLIALYMEATGPYAEPQLAPQAFIYGGQSEFERLFLPLHDALVGNGIQIAISLPADARDSPGIQNTAVVLTGGGPVFGTW